MRKPIPKALKYRLFYESQYRCVVCQQRGSHIHHIDQDNSNNDEANLVVLCTAHHDDAHTTRQLSQNLNSGVLRDAKGRWVALVRERRNSAATVVGQHSLMSNRFFSMGVTWGYINHRRVALLA